MLRLSLGQSKNDRKRTRATPQLDEKSISEHTAAISSQQPEKDHICRINSGRYPDPHRIRASITCNASSNRHDITHVMSLSLTPTMTLYPTDIPPTYRPHAKMQMSTVNGFTRSRQDFGSARCAAPATLALIQSQRSSECAE